MQGSIVDQVWNTVVAATLWSLWLARNETVFSKTNQSEEGLKGLIMFRVTQWGKVSNILCFGNEPLWKANPKGAVRVYYNRLSNDYWKFRQNSFDLVCSVDGAWGNSNFNLCTGSVGGYARYKKGNLIYVFSGPINAPDALSAEIEAILHIGGGEAASPPLDMQRIEFQRKRNMVLTLPGTDVITLNCNNLLSPNGEQILKVPEKFSKLNHQ
ncbi:hypothetical protein ACET3Z_024636 [Daucus carota]